MPFTINPIGESRTPVSSGAMRERDWWAEQAFSPDVAKWHIGNYRPGSLMGGPTTEQIHTLSSPEKYAIHAAPPPLSSAAVTRKEQAFGKFGTFKIDSIDPFQMIHSIYQGLGFSQDESGYAADRPQDFLQSKDIDLFGQGASGVPARLTDYALGLLPAIYAEIKGDPMPDKPKSPDSFGMQYKFQEDDAYWALLGQPGATDEALRGIAIQVASKHIQSSSNPFVIEQLYEQFKRDRDVAQGISSGDKKTDNQAKMIFTGDYITQRTGGPEPTKPIYGAYGRGFGLLSAVGGQAGVKAYQDAMARGALDMPTRYSEAARSAALMQLPYAVAGAVPFIGEPLRDAAYQHPQQIQDAWRALSDEQRQKYYAEAGGQMLIGDLIVWLPLLGGFSAAGVAARAATSSVYLRGALKAYETVRNVSTSLMAVGAITATANWTAEIAIPGYSEGLGKRLDYARPVSQSVLGGMVNQIGFFTSGTFGVYTAAQLSKRTAVGIGGLLAKPLHLPTTGQAFLQLYRVMGDDATKGILVRSGLPDIGILDLAPKSLFLSKVLNYMKNKDHAIWDAYTQGYNTGVAALDAITDPVQRAALANEALGRAKATSTHGEAESVIKMMAEARRPRPLFAGAAQRAHDEAVRSARYLDDQIASSYAQEYGQQWLTRLAGGYSLDHLARYAGDTLTRLGGDATKLGAHNEEGWGQVIRYLHQYEFHRNNGLLHAAWEGADEAGKVTLMQADHLFSDIADDVLSKIVAAPGADGVAVPPPPGAQAIVARTIRERQEAAAWFADEWKPPAGVTKTPENVPPAVFAEWLNEIKPGLPSRRPTPAAGSPTADMPLNAFQVELDKGGLWVLAFKPKDEAGNAISYVQRSNGRVFKSPWLEYPMSDAESLALGNRNLMLDKMDKLVTGVRTWHLVEFQKGLLYRSLSSKLDVSAEQIELFHHHVMRLSRKIGAGPQTIGAVARSTTPLFGGALIAAEIDKIVAEVFGVAPAVAGAGAARRFVDRTGKQVDFYAEIARSYRQSFRFNLTAGLTSYLKANLPGGSAIAWASDIGYVAWRFNLSPIFKAGELWESMQLNAMRGAFIDSPARALWYKAGVGNDMGALNAELPFDPMIQGATGAGGVRDLGGISPGRSTDLVDNPSARLAGTAAVFARDLPETLGLKANIAAEQGAAEAMVATHGGGQLPSAGWLPQQPGRVVQPNEIPNTHTSALGDINPEALDPNVLPEDQGVWHATRSLDRVYDEGVKARVEIKPLEAPASGEGFNEWLDRIPYVPDKPGSGGRTGLFRTVSQNDWDAAQASGRLEAPSGMLTQENRVTANPADLRATTDEIIIEADSTLLNSRTVREDWYEVTEFSPPYKPTYIDMGPGSIMRVWKWDPAKGDHILIKESPYVRQSARQGLGGGTGRVVSTTPIKEHADEAARRMEFAGRAARNEITGRELVDHFADLYSDDWHRMGDIVHMPESAWAGTEDEALTLIRWIDEVWARPNLRVDARFMAVRDLDDALRQYGRQDGFSGSVILAGEVSDYASITAGDVGVVQLAVRKGVRGQQGTDNFELTFASDDLLVIDDRVRLSDLADDEVGLLEQLRATLAEQPKEGQLSIFDHVVGGNGIAPGMEQRARQILTKLEDVRNGNLDNGPTWEWMRQPPDVQAEFVAKLNEDGWHTPDDFWKMEPAEQQKVIDDLFAQGYVLHGSSLPPDVPNPRINNPAGFFTTNSLPDAEWYAGRRVGGAQARGRPPGTVYVAKLPPPERILDLADPAATGPLVEMAKEDAKEAIEQSLDGRGGPTAFAYAKAVDDLEGSWGPMETEGAAGVRMQYNRIDSALLWVAMKRQAWLEANKGVAHVSAFDVRYVNELQGRLNIDAIKTLEEPMVGKANLTEPESLTLDRARLRVERGKAESDEFAAEMAVKPTGYQMTPDELVRRDGIVANIRDAKRNLAAVERDLSPKIPVWIFRERPVTKPIDEVLTGKIGGEPTALPEPRVFESKPYSDIRNTSWRPGEPLPVSHEIDDAVFEHAPDGEFVYHMTPAANLESVAASGLHVSQPGGGDEAGVYFAENALGLRVLVPQGNRSSLTLLRTSKEGLTQQTRLTGGLGLDEFVSAADVPAERLEYLGADGAWHSVAPAAAPGDPNMMYRPRLDGTAEAKPIDQLYDEYQRRPGATDELGQTAGTAEAMFETLIPREAAEGIKQPGRWRDAWDTFAHPAKWKMERAADLQIRLARERFPAWLRLSGNDSMVRVFESMGIPESRWADWLLKDRQLEAAWLTSKDPADFAALLAHAGDDAATRARFAEFYASDEWDALAGLMHIGLGQAAQESFGVHFFNAFRSPLERSLNHPLLGLYPLSWTWKVAKEWALFLYNNKTLGINIGMTPAQAIAQITQAQKASFAQSNNQQLDEFLDYDGPLGSPIFIFNLILPGDWSSLPAAFSRPIRDYARPLLAGKELPDAGSELGKIVSSIGVSRDIRLFFESIGEVGDLLADPARAETPEQIIRLRSVKGDYTSYEPPINR